MNIIDTNVVKYVLEKQISLQGSYCMTPDVAEEVEITQLIYNQKTSGSINLAANSYMFDEGVYIKNYKKVLNNIGGRSFYNMTGFGDVSTIALIHTFLIFFEKEDKTTLFGNKETIVVYTNDQGLAKRIKKEFVGKPVEIKGGLDIL